MTTEELTALETLAAEGLALASATTPRLQRLRTVQDVTEFYSIDDDEDQHDLLVAEFNVDADADAYLDARTRVPTLANAVAALVGEVRRLETELGLRRTLKELVEWYESQFARGEFPGLTLEQMLVNNIKHPMA